MFSGLFPLLRSWHWTSRVELPLSWVVMIILRDRGTRIAVNVRIVQKGTVIQLGIRFPILTVFRQLLVVRTVLLVRGRRLWVFSVLPRGGTVILLVLLRPLLVSILRPVVVLIIFLSTGIVVTVFVLILFRFIGVKRGVPLLVLMVFNRLVLVMTRWLSRGMRSFVNVLKLPVAF